MRLYNINLTNALVILCFTVSQHLSAFYLSGYRRVKRKCVRRSYIYARLTWTYVCNKRVSYKRGKYACTRVK